MRWFKVPKEAAMKNSAIKRIGVPALVAVASFVFALPAPAANRPDDRSGVRGISVTNVTASVRPDDRAGFRAIGGTQSSASRPDDRAGFRGAYVRTVAPTVASLPADDGFDWSAAGAGAASATALILLLTGAALTLRRNYRRAGTPA
jgi:hypothetical protein